MTAELLPHLSTFVLVAEHGSFTSAGRALGITQAAVSQRVQYLEKHVRTGLIQRRPGSIALTRAGRTLFEYARRIVDLHAEARMALGDIAPETCGRLSIAASSVPGTHLLPPTLAAYRRAFPNVAVRVRISDTADVLRRVEGGLADLGFAGDSTDSTELIFERLAGDELVLVVPPGHRLSERHRVGVRDFVGEPLIQREKGSGSRRCLERALSRSGRDPDSLNTVLEVDGNEAIKDAVRQGLGLAVLSRRSVQHEALDGAIRALPVTGLRLDRDLLVVRNRQRTLSPSAQSFLSRLRSALEAMP